MVKGTSLQRSSTKTNLFSARIVFARRGSSPQPLSIELIYDDGKRAVHRLDLEFPDGIDDSELYWRKYDEEGLCAVYQRGLDGKYYDGQESKANTILEQRLERLIRENFPQNGKATKSK